jgi:transposase-like protein
MPSYCKECGAKSEFKEYGGYSGKPRGICPNCGWEYLEIRYEWTSEFVHKDEK